MPSGRYRHWITPAREGMWPTGVVCVDAHGYLYNRDPDGRHLTERLLSWHAAGLAAHDGEYRANGDSAGQDPAGFWDRVARLAAVHQNLWIVSHNCQRVWSLLGLWEGIEDGRIRLCDHDSRDSGEGRHAPAKGMGGYVVTEDPPNILRARVYGSCHPVTWVDARNYGTDPPATAECGRGVVDWLRTLVARVLYLCRRHDLSALKPTAGSQAMAAWRRSSYHRGVYVHTDDRATDLEGRGYCGGRCEARRIGVVSAPVWHVDFTSHYGWACASNPLPCRLLDYREYPGGRAAEPGRDYSGSIADVTVETDEPAYPRKRGDGVIWPVGRFRTTLCGPELCDALRYDRVKGIHAEATYALDYCLQRYATKMYALRQVEEREGVPGSADFIKRLIVTLPGKLGQLWHRWVDAPDVPTDLKWGEWYGEDRDGNPVRYRSVGGNVQRDDVDGYAPDSCPAIAGFVTSYGRLRLLGAIRRAGWQNVLYYDTDSLIVNAAGYASLRASEFMAQETMGYLTVKSTPAYCEIRGWKYYVEDRNVVCAGLPRGTVFDTGDGRHYVRYLNASEMAKERQRPDAVLYHGTYERAGEYRQGVVGNDGVVRPIVLNEE